MSVIQHDFSKFKVGAIDVTALKRNTDRTALGLIAPATECVEDAAVVEHSAEPIKKMEDIMRISRYFIERGKYRDNMLFIVGINFGLRVSDLRQLRFSSIINENFTFKETFPVFEIKTRNTRAKKKNRYVTVNAAVVDAVTLFLEHTPGVTLSDYMFRSNSNHGGNLNRPLDSWSIDRILKGAARDLGLTMRVSTHSLRKTFGYHQMVMGGNESRTLLLLQKMFNHSSPAQTLAYIGITDEEITEAYKRLNLGSTENYLVDSSIVEKEADVG